MDWSPKQTRALSDVKRWMDAGGKGVYRLFGFAGSGKTTLARHFAEGLDGETMYAAFTGKAAFVLQQKGCPNATTIHKLIYKPADKSKENLNRLRKELDDWTRSLGEEGATPEEIEANPQVQRIRQELAFEVQSHKKLRFTLNLDSELKKAKMLIVDEVSMVDANIGRDLESFGVPLLVLGDPAQLPPVMGTGYFINGEPNSLLDEVHRQAAGNPVLRMATDIREGRGLKRGEYGDSRVIAQAQVDKDEVMKFDQVLCGTNKMRHSINKRVRQLLGRPGPMPVPGDRLVCLRNNHELGLLNGSLWNADSCTEVDADSLDLSVSPLDGGSPVLCSAHNQYFQGGEPPHWHVKDHEAFDYGYCLTAHKAQGSQWDSCFIFDESRCFRADARKWLYTAVTRAAKRVVVVA